MYSSFFHIIPGKRYWYFPIVTQSGQVSSFEGLHYCTISAAAGDMTFQYDYCAQILSVNCKVVRVDSV